MAVSDYEICASLFGCSSWTGRQSCCMSPPIIVLSLVLYARGRASLVSSRLKGVIAERRLQQCSPDMAARLSFDLSLPSLPCTRGAAERKMLLKMPQKLLKTAHYIELGSYQHWPVLIPQRIRLYTYEQIPLFLKENPYITDGYRAHLPSKLCLRSIFMLSNETVNIWSHLLGFLLFFSLGVNDLSTVLPASGANREDYVIYAIGLFCFQVCMLCSVGYHLFSCHRSEKTCRRWLSLDYAGISVGILGCYVPGIFYAFYCNAFWRQVYLLTVLSLILAVFCAQVHPHYLSNEWRRIRMAIFCCVAGISVVPACHWVWLNGGYTTDVVKLFLPRVIVMYLIAASAFLFYVTKIPERYFPGQMNYLGASHQLWHILVVVMFYWWHQTAVYIMRFRHSQSCPTRTSSSSS